MEETEIAQEEKSQGDTPQSHKLPEGHCCKYCMKYDQFGTKCFVYWDLKKLCTMKVTNAQEWNEEKLMLGK